MNANVGKIFSGPAGYAIVLGVGGLVVWLLWNKAKAAGQAVLNVNQGTPYAGAGVVGTLGNLTNQASGGVLSSLGEAIGGKLFDWFGPSYDPNAAAPDTSTPPRQAMTVTSPVSPSPSVMPYSYKQATVDIPAQLGTDSLFTPSSGGGSSGNYIESGVPGTDSSAYGYYPSDF